MEGVITDPYEQQLLSFFKSCDQERKGSLNAEGLINLCKKLQLEEKGSELINNLIGGGSVEDRVTFFEFREKLIALLGQGHGMEQEPISTDTLTAEATPKVMFGRKKYGRKSLPSSHLDSSPEMASRQSSSGSDDSSLLDKSSALNPKKRKSIPDLDSQELADDVFVPSEYESNIDDRGINNPCAMSSENSDRQCRNSSASDSHAWIFDDTIGLKSSPLLNTSTADAETVVELWNGAGVHNAGSLLLDLGFTLPEVNVPELTSVLKEELAVLKKTDEAEQRIKESLLLALFSLTQEELLCTKASLELVMVERDKLQANVIEANEMASLLAEEVDENFVELERTSTMHLKALKQKHSEEAKALAEQLGLDRDLLLAKHNTMEARVKKIEEENANLTIELSGVKAELYNVGKERDTALQGFQRYQTLYKGVQSKLASFETMEEELNCLKRVCAVEQIAPLKKKVAELQASNTKLRDENDELSMRIEALTSELDAANAKLQLLPQADIVNIGEGDIVAYKATNNSDSTVSLSPPIVKWQTVPDTAESDLELDGDMVGYKETNTPHTTVSMSSPKVKWQPVPDTAVCDLEMYGEMVDFKETNTPDTTVSMSSPIVDWQPVPDTAESDLELVSLCLNWGESTEIVPEVCLQQTHCARCTHLTLVKKKRLH